MMRTDAHLVKGAVMKRSFILPFFAVCFGATASTAAHANKYILVDLGVSVDISGGISVNNKNQIAINTPSPTRGEVYRKNTWNFLPKHSEAWQINENGDVVGGDYQLGQPKIWPRHGDPISIELPPEAASGVGLTINDAGTVAGEFKDAKVRSHCFTWTADSGSVEFGKDQLYGCRPQSVNASGDVTGEAVFTGDLPQAFLWSQGKLDALAMPKGAVMSIGMAINDAGNVVGQAYPAGGTRQKAYLWTSSVVDLDPDDEFVATGAFSINKSGEIVGFARSRDAVNRGQAVRFSHSRVIKLANEVVNLGDWILNGANSINDSGVIVGVGTIGTRKSTPRAFMLIPQ
jgi:hypothetical protein